jgi:hypothetical protein
VGAGVVTLVFVASTCFYHSRGVRFDASPINSFDQLLDPILLRTRLWESVFYLHGQPPLYNLLTGVALKLSPDEPRLVLLPFFLACGLYTALCQYVLMLRLRVPVVVCTLVASAIVASPAFVLHEYWYFYPHLNVAWLSGALAWLAQSRGRPGREMAISAAHFAGLSLTRSLFHPLFFGLTAALVVAFSCHGVRRKALACFALPGLLLFLWCAKNQVLFGFFGTSSWASRNILNPVEQLVGRERVAKELAHGHLSPAAARRSLFESGTRNLETFRLEPKTTGIPALDNVLKQTSSFHPVSYNHWTFAATAHFYAEDARQLIMRYPKTYLHGLITQAVPKYFLPVCDDWLLWRNRRRIAELTNEFNTFETSTKVWSWLALGLSLSLCAIFPRGTSRDQRMLLAAALLAIAWVTAVGIVGELGENNRFRFKIVWLTFSVASAGYAWAIARLSSILTRLWRRYASKRVLNLASSTASPR